MLDVEVVTRLAERRVRGERRHDLRLGDAAHRPGVVAGDVDGAEDAHGSAGRDRAAVRARAEQATAHRHEVELHLEEARVAERVEGVLVQVAVGDLVQQRLVRGVAGVVDEAEGAAAPPVEVVAARLVDPGEQVVGRHPHRRQSGRSVGEVV